MKKQLQFLCRAFPVLLLMPYLVTILCNGSYAALVNRKFDFEMCVPILTAGQISFGHEKETIKVQTIIARTNLYVKLQKENIVDILCNVKEKFLLKTGNNSFTEKLLLYRKLWVYENAAEETKDKVLVYLGELHPVPYHKVSSGSTRDGEEVFHDKAYTYLKSVDSSQDKRSADYLTSVYISEQQMPEILKINRRDTQGYVLSLLADEKILEGEAFSLGMNLASSNFSIQKVGNNYRFLCKGKGHGLGFSQYGGNEMAKTGNNCEQILTVYFPKMEIMNINDIKTVF